MTSFVSPKDFDRVIYLLKHPEKIENQQEMHQKVAEIFEQIGSLEKNALSADNAIVNLGDLKASKGKILRFTQVANRYLKKEQLTQPEMTQIISSAYKADQALDKIMDYWRDRESIRKEIHGIELKLQLRRDFDFEQGEESGADLVSAAQVQFAKDIKIEQKKLQDNQSNLKKKVKAKRIKNTLIFAGTVAAGVAMIAVGIALLPIIPFVAIGLLSIGVVGLIFFLGVSPKVFSSKSHKEEAQVDLSLQRLKELELIRQEVVSSGFNSYIEANDELRNLWQDKYKGKTDDPQFFKFVTLVLRQKAYDELHIQMDQKAKAGVEQLDLGQMEALKKRRAEIDLLREQLALSKLS